MRRGKELLEPQRIKDRIRTVKDRKYRIKLAKMEAKWADDAAWEKSNAMNISPFQDYFGKLTGL